MRTKSKKVAEESERESQKVIDIKFLKEIPGRLPLCSKMILLHDIFFPSLHSRGLF